MDDVVSANILAATTKNKAALNEVYNIASGQEISLREVYSLIKNQLHVSTVEPIDEPSSQGELYHSWADIQKAQAFLNYNPQVTIEEGISRLVSRILQNR